MLGRGHLMKRPSWGDVYLYMRRISNDKKYLEIHDAKMKKFTGSWIPTQSDILAQDWQVYSE